MSSLIPLLIVISSAAFAVSAHAQAQRPASQRLDSLLSQPYVSFTQVTLDELLEEYQVLERLEQDTERQIVRNQRLFEKHDTLQAQLVRTSNTFEQAVAIIDHNVISLKQTQTKQTKKARIRAKFQRWLIHYYNRVNYVRTDYYYPRPQDRWANRTFFLGSFLLFGKGIIPIFKP